MELGSALSNCMRCDSLKLAIRKQIDAFYTLKSLKPNLNASILIENIEQLIVPDDESKSLNSHPGNYSNHFLYDDGYHTGLNLHEYLEVSMQDPEVKKYQMMHEPESCNETRKDDDLDETLRNVVIENNNMTETANEIESLYKPVVDTPVTTMKKHKRRTLGTAKTKKIRKSSSTPSSSQSKLAEPASNGVNALTKTSLTATDRYLERSGTGKDLRYICLICHKSNFSVLCNARLHIARVHLHQRWTCPQCRRKFYNITQLKEHQRTSHGSGKSRTAVSAKGEVVVSNPGPNFDLKKCLGAVIHLKRLKYPKLKMSSETNDTIQKPAEVGDDDDGGGSDPGETLPSPAADIDAP